VGRRREKQSIDGLYFHQWLGAANWGVPTHRRMRVCAPTEKLWKEGYDPTDFAGYYQKMPRPGEIIKTGLIHHQKLFEVSEGLVCRWGTKSIHAVMFPLRAPNPDRFLQKRSLRPRELFHALREDSLPAFWKEHKLLHLDGPENREKRGPSKSKKVKSLALPNDFLFFAFFNQWDLSFLREQLLLEYHVRGFDSAERFLGQYRREYLEDLTLHTDTCLCWECHTETQEFRRKAALNFSGTLL
jgi:hypothetical protein